MTLNEGVLFCRGQEDSQILARMSTLLPEVHTLALVFRDIAALYNAGEDDRRYLLNLQTVLPKVRGSPDHQFIQCSTSTLFQLVIFSFLSWVLSGRC